MEFLTDLFNRLRDLPALIQWAGYVGLTAIIFVETGLFFGFFLPGDSLLVTAGLLASQGFSLDVYVLGVLLNIAAIVGDNTNYWIGRYMGPRVFTRDESLFFRRRHVERAHDFYERHGAKTVVLARFMPIIRTFAPLVAGVAKMSYRTPISRGSTAAMNAAQNLLRQFRIQSSARSLSVFSPSSRSMSLWQSWHNSA